MESEREFYARAAPHQEEKHDLPENRGDIERGREFDDFLRRLNGLVVNRRDLYRAQSSKQRTDHAHGAEKRVDDAHDFARSVDRAIGCLQHGDFMEQIEEFRGQSA